MFTVIKTPGDRIGFGDVTVHVAEIHRGKVRLKIVPKRRGLKTGALAHLMLQAARFNPAWDEADPRARFELNS